MPERLELPTLCLEGKCSIQLSYGTKKCNFLSPAGASKSKLPTYVT